MYEITALKPTIMKTKLLPFAELASKEMLSVLPGYYLETDTLIDEHDGYCKVVKHGKPWYIYRSDWEIQNIGIYLDLNIMGRVYHKTKIKILKESLNYINRATHYYDINLTPIRLAYFLAQVGYESAGLTRDIELTSIECNKKSLGNIEPEDMVKYRGRGILPLRGRVNYRNAGNALGIDLESNPELIMLPKYKFAIACWLWNSRNLNLHADREDFEKVTWLIGDGNLIGWEEKLEYLDRAKQCLLT